MARKTSEKLTPQHRRFVTEYVAEMATPKRRPSATAAYLRAYPTAAYTTARNNAAKLLAKACIREAIEREQRRATRQANATPERAVAELARLAFADVGDVAVIDDKGRFYLRPGSGITPDARKAIKAIKPKSLTLVQGKGKKPVVRETVELVMHDKLGALDRLFRHLGLFKDLPPLEVLLAALPPDIVAVVRAGLAAAVHGGPGAGGGGGAGGQPAAPVGRRDARPDPGGPDVPDAGGGADPGPVAGDPDPVPGEEDHGPVHPPEREDADGGVSDHGPLFDAEN